MRPSCFNTEGATNNKEAGEFDLAGLFEYSRSIVSHAAMRLSLLAFIA